MAVLGAAGSLPGAEVVSLGLDPAEMTGALDLADLHSQLRLGAAMAIGVACEHGDRLADLGLGEHEGICGGTGNAGAVRSPLVADRTCA